jgi:lysophospholipase L1-like esterase
MKKLFKNLQDIIILLLMITFIFIITIGTMRDNKIKKELVIASDKYTAEQLKEEKRIAGLNFYQDLKEHRNINALIIGDSISQGDRSDTVEGKWFNKLKTDIKSKYNSNIDFDLISGGSTTSVRGWVELNQASLTEKYDIAFICFGQNDQADVTPEQFKIFYESIINKVKKLDPNIEIIPIIESSLRNYNAYSNIIVDLSNHYGFQYADTIQAFNASGQPYTTLSKDGIHPNDKGYAYYESTIEQIIDKNYTANKQTNAIPNVLYVDTNKLNFNFNSSPENNGFSNNNGFVGSAIGNSLIFNTSSNTAIIHFMRQPNGGKFKIYVDGNLIKEIDTNLSFNVSYSNIVFDNLQGQHKVKIEISSLPNNGAVKILGLATN